MVERLSALEAALEERDARYDRLARGLTLGVRPTTRYYTGTPIKPDLMRRVVVNLALLAVGTAVVAAEGRAQAAECADTASFYRWWMRMASTDVGPGGDTILVGLPASVGRTGLRPASLRPPPRSRTDRPAGLDQTHWVARSLYERDRRTLILWLSTDSTGFPGPAPTCSANMARLGVVPGGGWTELPLNPYCEETYGPDEADIILYWLAGEEWPHVEVATNGPACVPSVLLRFDPSLRRYIVVRRACAS